MRTRALALVVALGLGLAARARAADTKALELGRWEVTRAARGGDLTARARFDVPAALASRALALVVDDARWDASVQLDGRVLAEHRAGRVRVEVGALAKGRHELVVRARDVRGVLPAFVGAARLVPSLPLDVVSARAEPGRLVLDVVARSDHACALSFHSDGGATAHVTTHLVAGARRTLALPWPDAPRYPRTEKVAIAVADDVVATERLALPPDAPRELFIVDAPANDGGARAVSRARACGANVIATGGRRDDAWFAAVEDAGLLVLDEPEVAPASALALGDEALLDSFADSLRDEVRRRRGRPSIVAWSLARGLLREGGANVPRLRERLAALASELRSLDPRPVLLRGDDARALGFALPFSEEPLAGAIALLPSGGAPLGRRVERAGDPGFLDASAVARGLARERVERALAARAAGAAGIDLGDGTPADELAHALAASVIVPVGEARAVTSGEPIERAFVACGPPRSPVHVPWSLAGEKGEVVAAIDPDGRSSFVVRAVAPAVADRTVHVLRIRADGSSVDVPLVVFPPRPPAPPFPIVLFDRDGRTASALDVAGITSTNVPTTPEKLARGSVLVIGEGALDQPALRARGVPLIERARRTGVPVLVLRQEKPLPDGVAPPLEANVPRGATALALRFESDLVRTEDLAWPRVLEAPALARPVRADARVLVDSAPAGIAPCVGAIALEDGPARTVICQVRLVNEPAPAARALLAALVREAARPVRAGRAFFARGDAELGPLLESLALVPRAWDVAALDSHEPIVLVDDLQAPLSPEERSALRRAAENGATVIARVTSTTTLARLAELAPRGARIEPSRALPVPLVPGLGALDLLWPPSPGARRDVDARFDATPLVLRADLPADLASVTSLVAPGALVERRLGRGRVVLDLVRWREAPPRVEESRRWIARVLSELGAETHEPPIRLPVGAWRGIGRKGSAIAFTGNGTATARFLVNRSGRWRVRLDLSGTVARGEWPEARVTLDARVLGTLRAASTSPTTYELEATIPAGRHALSVTFTNDAFEPPEDRDLFLGGAVLEALPPRVY